MNLVGGGRVKRFIVVTINRTRRDGIDTHLVVDTDAEEVMASCRSKVLRTTLAGTYCPTVSGALLRARLGIGGEA